MLGHLEQQRLPNNKKGLYESRMQSDTKQKLTKKQQGNILVAGIVGGILLGAALTVFTGNPFPQVGIGVALGVIAAVLVIVLKR